MGVRQQLPPTVCLDSRQTAGKTRVALRVLGMFYSGKSGDLKRTVLSSPGNLHKEKGQSRAWGNKLKVLS